VMVIPQMCKTPNQEAEEIKQTIKEVMGFSKTDRLSTVVGIRKNIRLLAFCAVKWDSLSAEVFSKMDTKTLDEIYTLSLGFNKLFVPKTYTMLKGIENDEEIILPYTS